MPSDYVSPLELGTFFESDTSHSDMNGYGYLYKGNVSQNTFSIGQQQWNGTFTAMGTAVVVSPSGRRLPPQLGYFFIGGSDSFDDTALCPNYTCDPAAYLYNQNIIKSRAYGMHMSSASLQYTGSLVICGYDRGRAIGPTVDASDSSSFQLLDMMIGVETGASPYDFDSEDGLLQVQNGSSAAQPLTVGISPEDPYVFLPPQTIAAITGKLPVYYDTTSDYYLWNTSDSSYSKIINSPSYLGFVFLGTSRSAANITIKVPFKLLNLTLEPTISGLTSDLPYFPLQPMTPPDFSYPYSLGRAFLQAAFLGSNFGQNVTWLAQAPGPGSERRGLGYDLTDIEDTDATLSLQTGDSLFNSSWAGVWTPIPIAAAKGQSTGSSTSASGTSSISMHVRHGLSGGATAGVVVGALVGALLIVGVASLLLWRKRRSRKLAEKAELQATSNKKAAGFGDKAQLDGNRVQRSELPSDPVARELPAYERAEMSARAKATELPSQVELQELLAS